MNNIAPGCGTDSPRKMAAVASSRPAARTGRRRLLLRPDSTNRMTLRRLRSVDYGPCWPNRRRPCRYSSPTAKRKTTGRRWLPLSSSSAHPVRRISSRESSNRAPWTIPSCPPTGWPRGSNWSGAFYRVRSLGPALHLRQCRNHLRPHLLRLQSNRLLLLFLLRPNCLLRHRLRRRRSARLSKISLRCATDSSAIGRRCGATLHPKDRWRCWRSDTVISLGYWNLRQVKLIRSRCLHLDVRLHCWRSGSNSFADGGSPKSRLPTPWALHLAVCHPWPKVWRISLIFRCLDVAPTRICRFRARLIRTGSVITAKKDRIPRPRTAVYRVTRVSIRKTVACPSSTFPGRTKWKVRRMLPDWPSILRSSKPETVRRAAPTDRQKSKCSLQRWRWKRRSTWFPRPSRVRADVRRRANMK